MASIFRFKEFSVDQSNCTMKINTDGVLLAAMCDSSEPRNILDIGTGTGVIAMMLAQQYKNAKVYALDIDGDSVKQASENFRNSIFSNRLTPVHRDIMHYTPAQSLDLIISNPPFFINSLKNPYLSKSLARHTDWCFFESLLDFSKKHISEQGSLQCILPTETADKLIAFSKNYGLYLQKEICISSFQDSSVIRKIIQFCRQSDVEVRKEFFYIYKEQKVYSQAYTSLLKPYFINF